MHRVQHEAALPCGHAGFRGACVALFLYSYFNRNESQSCCPTTTLSHSLVLLWRVRLWEMWKNKQHNDTLHLQQLFAPSHFPELLSPPQYSFHNMWITTLNQWLLRVFRHQGQTFLSENFWLQGCVMIPGYWDTLAPGIMQSIIGYTFIFVTSL